MATSKIFQFGPPQRAAPQRSVAIWAQDRRPGSSPDMALGPGPTVPSARRAWLRMPRRSPRGRSY
eukprot:1384633-Lingulodinium_polyedra.AAC.1